jgi:hypothetical protein
MLPASPYRDKSIAEMVTAHTKCNKCDSCDNRPGRSAHGAFPLFRSICDSRLRAVSSRRAKFVTVVAVAGFTIERCLRRRTC